MRSRSLGALACIVVAMAGRVAAADPDPDPASVSHTATGTPEREIAVLPLVGGDTDNGFGAGAIGSVAMFDPGQAMYRWRVEFGGFYAVKDDVTDPSYEDAYALITWPQLLAGRLRLELRPSFTKDTALQYYGIGNLAPQPNVIVATRDFYERVHPAISAMTYWRGPRTWFALLGAKLTYNHISYDPSSTLARDQQQMPGFDVQQPHGVATVETGVVYDTRDNELAPQSGQYHQIKFRISPQIGNDFPYSYQQVNAIARYYATLIPHKLVFAVRGVFDVQLGNVPFYEMSRYEDTSAIGGSQGVRGVPAYRFYGRVKAFGNVELRTETTHFHWYGKPFILGFVGFFDAGRLWTAIDTSNPALDGTGLGLHYGVGGGIRIQQGRSFLVRADLAWSPDAQPIGAYVLANHAF